MASLPDTLLTEEQYLALERAPEAKHDFQHGRMYPRATCSFDHCLIATRIGSILCEQVPPGCLTFDSSLRLKVVSTGLYTYPDCSVARRPLQLADEQEDVLLNPILIVEVSSPVTEGYDRGLKFESYRTIESLKEYLLIVEDRRHVEHYSKQEDGSWVLREYSRTEDTVAIPRLNVQVSLAGLYEDALSLG